MKEIKWSKSNNNKVAANGFCISEYSRKNARHELSNNDFFEAILVTAGSSVIIVEGRASIITKGDIVLISPAEMFCFDNSSSEDFEAISVCLSVKYTAKLSTEKSDLSTCFRKTSAAKCNVLKCNEKYFKRFVTLVRLATASKQVFGRDIMEKVNVATFLVTLNRLTYELISDGTIEETLIDKIVSYVENNLNKELTLDSVAKQFNLSTSRLTHFFKDETKVSLYRFITQKRLAKAKNLLGNGYGIKEAANMSGYNDISNFYRAFKEAFNTTPKEYSEMMK